ncbi:hypothetical protein BDW68DRAFT_8426 [Aspergillus falconensis]
MARVKALRNMRCNAYQRRQPTWSLPLHFTHFSGSSQPPNTTAKGEKRVKFKKELHSFTTSLSSLDFPIGLLLPPHLL